MTAQKEKFDLRRFLWSVAAIAVPVAAQNLLTTTGSMIDTMMLAPLGETVIGAVGLCAQFSSLMFSCYWGFVGGGILFFAQYWGAQDKDGIDRAFETTLAFLMIVAATFAGLAIFAPQLVMRLYTDKAAITEVGVRYLRIVGFAYPFQILSVLMSALLRSTDHARIPLIGAIASVTTNIGMNYLLIYGKLGFPEMGVRGAALATVIASVCNFAVIFVAASVKKYPYLVRFLRHLRLSGKWLKEYFSKCAPIILNELLIGIGFAVENMVLGRQAEEAIAALAVFRTVEGLIIAFFTGFSNAAAVLIGNDVGAGNLRRAFENSKRLVYFCGAIIAVADGAVFALHGPLLRAMGLSGTSFTIGTTFVGIYCIAAVIRMCNWTQTDLFRVGGDAAFGAIVEITALYVIVLPCVCLTGLVFHAPVWVVFLCCYIDEPLRFFLMQRHLFSAKWIKPVTEQGKESLAKFLEEREKK